MGGGLSECEKGKGKGKRKRSFDFFSSICYIKWGYEVVASYTDILTLPHTWWFLSMKLI